MSQTLSQGGRDDSGQIMVEVLEAETGEEGLELFQNNSDILYAVVDVHLPGIDGFEMLNACRKHDPERFDRLTVFMSCSDADDHHPESPDFPAPSWVSNPRRPGAFQSISLE